MIESIQIARQTGEIMEWLYQQLMGCQPSEATYIGKVLGMLAVARYSHDLTMLQQALWVMSMHEAVKFRREVALQPEVREAIAELEATDQFCKTETRSKTKKDRPYVAC